MAFRLACPGISRLYRARYYKTSKARVCVTVGMMTTGYDCPDILNLALMRPIFSPTDFIQIKGRGTRKHDFREDLFDEDLKAGLAAPQKTAYKLFDFFANCEYFEEEFDYDQVIPLPKPQGEGEGGGGGGGPQPGEFHEYDGPDIIDSKRFTELYTTSAFTVADLKAVPPKYRKIIPDYIKDYVSLNQFVA